MEIAVIADIHLGLKRASEKWHKFHIEWAEWLKNELNKSNIHNIIISGDFFHYRDEINVQTLHVANLILDIWQDFNITILTGNHDCYYKDNSSVNSLSIFKNRLNVRIIDKYLYEKGISYVPWGTDIQEIKKSDIIFGHFDIASFKMSSGVLSDNGEDPFVLADLAKIIFTGHFHLRQERHINESIIIYTGNPFQMDFGDMKDKKGYYIFNTMTNKYKFFEYKTGPRHLRLKDSEYLIKKKYKNSYIEINLSSKYLQSLIKDNNPDKNIDELDLNFEVGKIISDIRSFANSNNPIECRINKEQLNIIKNEERTVSNSAISIIEISNEIIDALDYEYTAELKNKISELLK